MNDDTHDDKRTETDVNEDYRYDEDAEGHENQLEFDRDYTTYDKLKDTGLISEAREEAVRKELEKDRPEDGER